MLQALACIFALYLGARLAMWYGSHDPDPLEPTKLVSVAFGITALVIVLASLIVAALSHNWHTIP